MTTASVFTGIKLSDESRSNLLSLAKERFKYLHQNVKADHVTIKFKGNPNEIPKELMGAWVRFQASHLIEKEGIQVVALHPLEEAEKLEYANPPHCTIAHAEGVKPSHSNEILRDTLIKEGVTGVFIMSKPFNSNLIENTFCGRNLILAGQVGFVHNRHGWVFTHLPKEEMV